MIGRGKVGFFAAALIAIVAIAMPVAAQTTTATVTGTVKDGQGGVIPGATVTLISEARGTRSTPVVTNTSGDFTFPNVTADTYSIEVTMSGFKTLKRPGIIAGAGNRVAVGTLTIEVGGMSETVEVKGESPVIQATTGERSFTVTTDSVENLPIASRSFTALASLAPGVSGNNRLGGGGANNVMMDGVSTMDTGSNSVLLQMNVESIAEVKVLVSNYQAEYGRSSGLQITAVTKSGTNRFRGSFYDVERDSDWYSNSKVNKLNNDPKTVLKERDWGYSIGGPVGRPGGANKLFFFYSQEFEPRTGGNDVRRFRFPTLQERQGDFSATTDNVGNPFPYIRDYRLSGQCSATTQAACYAEGGVVGKLPANRLYQPGLNILNMYPMPNIQNVPAGQAYNYEITRPSEKLLAWQPAIRFDYNVMNSLRTTFKYSGWAQRKGTINGTIPGWNDTRMQNPVVSTWTVTANYNLSPTMFLEATYGQSQNELAGCALAQNNTGPNFCTAAFPMNPIANRNTAGLGGLPYLFPDAVKIQESYYAFRVLNDVAPPIWENGRIQMAPALGWGNRVANAPTNMPFPGYLNINATKDVAISMTKIAGRHTIKMGFYNTHSFKAQQRGGWAGNINFQNDTNNPLDAQFGFANAALGIFSSYQQASAYVEGSFKYDNTEGYIQDNWKLNEKMTLDYGVRLVRQQPQYDTLGQASNFLQDKWVQGQAPQLYIAGCNGVPAPCSGASRQAQNPINNQFLGPNSLLAIGGIVPGSGNPTNGLFLSGQGIVDTTYKWPLLALAPRFGLAYDVSGKQSFVLRGGMGLFFDRPSGNSIYSQVQNPPTYKDVTVRYGELQTLSGTGLAIEGPPALNVFEYEGDLPASTQWNFGVQMMLPWNTSLDVEYVGQHSYRTLEGVDLNSVDYGAAYLGVNQDPTLTPNPAVPGSTAVSQDRMRALRGYAGINQQLGRGVRTYHSLQLSFQRRFANGFSFGFNDTIGLYDRQTAGARIQHNLDGTWSYRSDQAQADELLGNNNPVAHTMKGNFVWDLPDLKQDSSVMRAIGYVINDWQLSGIWTAATGGAYTVGANYTSNGGNVNLTGSPNYGGRVILLGDPGAGCSSNPYQQFNTAAFQGPGYNSVGLESGNGYLRGCFTSVLDLAIARNIRLGGNRNLQLRVDMFNAPNSAIVTGRNTTMNLGSPATPTTITNLPYNPDGSLIATRSLPRGAGFGVANDYQNPRTIQFQVRFSF